ncbi:protein of unknown function [Legionella fallonii LLAP-10]|uniref:Uncharacterized protein n=1 Tax=Legionella fallonii LLAP-10 TaxID=1212491 RepID=A0A098G7N6_9GAMM|nr:protein of unknown function [Legionella fallonii LLAP-10]
MDGRIKKLTFTEPSHRVTQINLLFIPMNLNQKLTRIPMSESNNSQKIQLDEAITLGNRCMGL